MESTGSVGEEPGGNQRAATAVCWGELLWDLFPSGALLGGAPSNVAVHLAGLGVDTALVTRVGKDELGNAAIEGLVQRGVRTEAVQRDASMQTGRVGIEVVEGEPRYTLHPGAWQRIELDENARALCAGARILCYGTLSQEWGGLPSWRDAIAATASDCIRICDPNLRGGRIDPPLVLEHLEAATVVKMNDAEAEAFRTSYGCADAAQWLLHDKGIEMVAHTHGAQGATLLTRDDKYEHPGFPAAAGGDNVGAGDGFTAALARGLLAGLPLDRLALSSCRYGAFVASKTGATPAPSPELLDELLGASLI